MSLVVWNLHSGDLKPELQVPLAIVAAAYYICRASSSVGFLWEKLSQQKSCFGHYDDLEIEKQFVALDLSAPIAMIVFAGSEENDRSVCVVGHSKVTQLVQSWMDDLG